MSAPYRLQWSTTDGTNLQFSAQADKLTLADLEDFRDFLLIIERAIKRREHADALSLDQPSTTYAVVAVKNNSNSN